MRLVRLHVRVLEKSLVPSCSLSHLVVLVLLVLSSCCSMRVLHFRVPSKTGGLLPLPTVPHFRVPGKTGGLLSLPISPHFRFRDVMKSHVMGHVIRTCHELF